MPQDISQFAVTVRDYDEALAFYVVKLRLELVEDGLWRRQAMARGRF